MSGRKGCHNLSVLVEDNSHFVLVLYNACLFIGPRTYRLTKIVLIFSVALLIFLMSGSTFCNRFVHHFS